MAEGIVTTCQYNPDSDIPQLKAFQTNYYKRFGIEPDVFAAHAYDGMNLIIEAINKAGLNRVLIRDVLTDLKTFQGYPGITGKMYLIIPGIISRTSGWLRFIMASLNFPPAPPMDPKNKVSSKTGNY